MPDLSPDPPPPGPSSRFLAGVGWFVPDAPRDRVTLLRAQFYVVLCGLVALNAGMFAVLHTLHHAPGANSGGIWALWTLFGMGLGMPFLLRLGVPLRSLTGVFVVVVGVGLAVAAAFDGGLASGSVFWLLSLPLGAAFLGGARLGWASAALSIVIGVGLYVASALGVVFPNSLSEADRALHYVINFFAAGLFIPALAALYEGPMIRHFRRLSDQLGAANGELRKELVLRERAQARAEAANRAKDALLANMSHEFRTPLTAILGFTDLLGDEVAPEHRPFLTSIDRGAHRLLGTLDGVLGLAWIESSGTGLDPSLADVRAEAAEVAGALRPIATTRGLALSVEGPTVHAVVDPSALRRVLHALVDNAIRFTESGSVAVSVSTAEGRARIRVSDTGIGMDATFVDAAFEPFRQASEGHARTHEGVGVGLTVARRLTEVMGGTIDVQTAPGRGTVVTVELPATHETAPALVPSSAWAPSPPAEVEDAALGAPSGV